MSSGSVIKMVVLGGILASDLYFVEAGLVRPSLVVAQVMMILTVWILRVARERAL
jgi:hypothetical protein